MVLLLHRNFIILAIFIAVFSVNTNVLAEVSVIDLEKMGVSRSSDSEINIRGSSPLLRCIEPLLTGIDRGASRIVNGRSVDVGQLPWQVALLATIWQDNKRAHFCGGVLIHKNWVLTAAHCVDGGTTARQVQVLAGETSLLSSATQRISVNRIIIHPDYDEITKNNDIALLNLQAPAEGKNISPIHLITAEQEDTLIPTMPLVVSGWGAIYESGSSGPMLHEADVSLIERQRCNGSNMYEGRISDVMICAGKKRGGVDSCQGDSGGPLALIGESSKLVGLVSWGDGCARPNKPGVYTRVSSFNSWVASNIAKSN
jgi:secreted trypsin-like serine protease